MKNFKPQGCRMRHTILPKVGILPVQPLYLRSCLLFTFAVALFLSCSPLSSEISSDSGDTEQVQDSVLLSFNVCHGTDEVKKIDLFVFKDDGAQELVEHETVKGCPKTVEILSVQGASTVIGIANSPKAFNLKALSRMDAFKELEYNFSDDNPECPIMSAEATGDSLVLSRMMCRVVLRNVSNGMDDYRLLESPRVRLTELTSSAKILQKDGFHPTESIEYGEWKELPCDVGLFTQNPGIVLYCYPNDTPETTLGAPHTSLELECTIDGEKCSFPISLPPLGRGSSVAVDIDINGAGDYTQKTY